MYIIKFNKIVLRKFKKLDKNTLLLIKKYIDKNLKNTDDPRIHGKPLTANLKGLWRYRIMDYRLIADIQDEELIIVAIDFEHRSRIY